ncbi:DNA polymerase III subunit delta [Siculibacillus lacustris]|uniref:DNA polymerase III subunit delta n=1 Tax=Siculibacillus lacustris TaxID=1549641 RepID=A0A4Q9VKH9_9HYPH|nr:DNA polymerase III subunit delta [Siculibacillus lacustris]TBW35807.1 DNA polymerase III subunit delta [Siculibacillus lacustris]
MVALKGSEIDGFLRRPGDRASLVLIYGPDDGLVAERGVQLVAAAGGRSDDPFSLVRLDGATLVDDPSRLIDEASTVSLFGARRIVWIRDAGSRNILSAVQPLLDRPDTASLVVIEAGDLKKGTGLRKRVEDHPNAIALPCYSDGAEELSRLIDRELAEFRMTIDRDAREVLEAHLGADRLASRGEIRKLCLYAHGRARIGLADVTAVVGDASAFAVDELLDAAAGGDLAAADMVLRKLAAAGTNASVAGTMLIRHFQLLQRIRAEVGPGRSASDVVGALQPPIFFRRRPEIVRQLGLWTRERLGRALDLLDEAMLRSRRMPLLADAVIADAVVTLARVARAAARR